MIHGSIRAAALMLGTLLTLYGLAAAGQAKPAAGQAKPTAQIRIAAASDLQTVMPTLAAEYEKQTGVKLAVSTGSSSALATQILNGAPFDLFLGADYTFPEKVVAAGLSESKSPVPYATGTLVLWARKDSPIKPLSMDRLEETRVTRIAIADEFHAPYGRAAYAALRRLKLEDKLKPKLIVGENVSQTAQFIETGNAQMGLISLTLASSGHLKEVGEFVLVPRLYPDIRQCGVVLKGKNAPAAQAFLDWLRSAKVQEALEQFGLKPAK